MAKKLTSKKAKKILHDKEVHGKPLTEKQRKFFGAVASGAVPKAQKGIILTDNWEKYKRYQDSLSRGLNPKVALEFTDAPIKPPAPPLVKKPPVKKKPPTPKPTPPIKQQPKQEIPPFVEQVVSTPPVQQTPAETRDDIFNFYGQGTPVYGPTAYGRGYSGKEPISQGVAGFRDKSGKVTYIKPEHYQTMGVNKTLREWIESQGKKQYGGAIPKAQNSKKIVPIREDRPASDISQTVPRIRTDVAYKPETVQQDTISATPKKKSALSKAMQQNAYPLTTLSYRMKGQEPPENLEYADKNPFDYALSVVNPFSWIEGFRQAPREFDEGNYLSGTLGTLGIVPFVGAGVQAAREAVPLMNELGALGSEFKLNYLTDYSKPENIVKIKNAGLLNRQLGPRISGNKGHFNEGVFTMKKNPNVIVKFEDPQLISGVTGNYEYDKFNFVEAMKDIPSDAPLAKVFHQIDLSPNKRALFMNKVEGVPTSSLTSKELQSIPQQSYIDLYENLKKIRNRKLAFDFAGDNLLYNANKQQFGLVDINPSFESIDSPGDWWTKDILGEMALFGADEKAYEVSAKNMQNALMGKLSRDQRRALVEYFHNRDKTIYANDPFFRPPPGRRADARVGTFNENLRSMFENINTDPRTFYQNGGAIEGTMGGLTDKGFNYNGAWNGPSMQMGGTLPGMTGFMYARTGAPSNGPYAKKTKASAQNGMTFYQHGLDWKPRNISQNGSIIEDDMGQWAYPGEITKINSNEITMDGVPYPVLGISDTGDAQMMYPDENYTFDGESVTEYPMMQMGGSIQDKGQLKKLDQLTNFTNYNNMAKKGKKIKKAQIGSYIGGDRVPFNQIDAKSLFDQLNYSVTGRTPEDMADRQSVGSQIADTLKDFELNMDDQGDSELNKKGKLQGVEGNPENLKGMFDFLSPGAGGASGAASLAMMVKKGGKMKKAQVGQFLANNASDITGVAQGAGKVIGAVTQVVDAIKAKQQAKQSRALSELSMEASGTRPEQTKRRYVRPEDQLVDPGQTFPTYGTGTDFLQLQDGGVINEIGGNPTEIQNMYNPGTLYSDLGYEPLMDSNTVKNYKYGGKAQLGVGMIAQGVGSAAQLLGGLTSGIINIGTNRMLKQTEQNLGATAFQQGMQAQQAGSPFMKRGGYLSHDFQPQEIVKFGDYTMDQLLAPDKTMDTLRAGGNIRDIRSNYMGDDEKVRMMAMGGQLKTHWGGGAELMSYNPYMPGSGETWMLKGQSHDETDGKGRSGIGITYGNSMVEAERGEPVSEVEDGGQIGEAAVVYGDLPISDFSAAELNDPKSKGKKFKTYVADLAKKERKSNKTMDKAMDILQDVKGNSPFNMLSLSTAQAMITGADMTLKDIAMKKRTAAQLQDVFNETAEEQGLDATSLAAGRIKEAKYDENGEIAQKGKKMKKKSTAPRQVPRYIPQPIIIPRPAIPKVDPAKLPSSSEYMESVNRLVAQMTENAKKQKEEFLRQRREQTWDAINTVSDVALPFVRASNQKPLSAEQIIPEMTALSLNQLEPVQAQLYQPMLTQVSKLAVAQPKINEINAQFNAMQKTIGNNPAALDYLAGQKYKAISQAVGEEFAMNQQREDAMRAQNIATLNDAALKNMAILDTQFQRQAAAKSATKAQALSALSSISEKVAQNKLENLTMGVYENMYNFRFGPKGVAYNLNPLARFNMQDSGLSSSKSGNLSSEHEYSYDAYGNIIDVKKKSSKSESQRNGGIVKAMKNL